MVYSKRGYRSRGAMAIPETDRGYGWRYMAGEAIEVVTRRGDAEEKEEGLGVPFKI